MSTVARSWIRMAWMACMAWTMMMASALAQQGGESRLVTAAWLQQHLGEVLLLDASVTPHHMAGHIPGAVSADLYRYGPNTPTPQVMEQRLQSWGVSPGRKIVVYDQGADSMATRLFFDLYYNGVPAGDIHYLDGGLAQWKAMGGAVTKEPTPTPAPAPGTYRITQRREEQRVRLPEFLVASGDRERVALVEALEPGHHYGAEKFFDRAGHIPNALLMPSTDFFNADKTLKSPDEIRRMARYMGIKPDQPVYSHCGGGVAASVPWFALQFLAGHGQTRIYIESQREWLRDERQLPFWTYSAPQLRRDSAWLNGWNNAMLRMFSAAELNLVDVRSADQYAMGHMPFALSIPADGFSRNLGRSEALAALLGPAGVNPAHEVVLVAESGLTPGAAMAFLALEQLGHRKVSVLMDSVDEWGLRGYELTKEATTVGQRKSMKDMVVPPTKYVAGPRKNLVISSLAEAGGEYPRVLVASGRAASNAAAVNPPEGRQARLVRLPYTEMLNGDGTPKPAGALWKLINEAGVPRQAELVLFADDPAEAAVNYYIFRLMGWPDVKVWVKS